MRLSYKKFKYFFGIGIFILIFVCVPDILAMQSSNYIINWDSINAGGTDNSTSANYKLRDTMGQMGPGWEASANWRLHSGYRVPYSDPEQLTFKVNAQNNSTKVSYTAFGSADYTVTLSDTTGYATDDYIAVVENEGPSQLVAVGQITNINGATKVITTDKWSGDQATMNAAPAGGDDFVYKMNTHLIALGNLTTSSVTTGVAMTEVLTNAPGGYTVYVAEDHNLWHGIGPNDISDVADGTVTAGSEEYGIETTGDNAVGAGDWAILSSVQQVANSNDQAVKERVGIIYKASIDGSTIGGAYSHTTSYYCIADF